MLTKKRKRKHVKNNKMMMFETRTSEAVVLKNILCMNVFGWGCGRLNNKELFLNLFSLVIVVIVVFLIVLYVGFRGMPFWI